MDRKEAIEVIREYYPSSGKDLNEALETLIPELKESEDERVKKFLAELVKAHTISPMRENALAWLERQGENVYNEELSKLLHEVICSFINNPNIPYSRREEVSKKIIPYVEKIEKQGEQNPKSADFIPTDCTSDVKYENRWHKVEDSLPDNNREVLCKDAIGNFFIGRYYNDGDYWEVSMYDEPDKSNKDNPPVIMWANIPSCEQNLANPEKTCKDEQNEAVLDALIRRLEGEDIYVSPHLAVECLKSLKERYTWKPSDEQINTLWDAIVYVEGCNSNFKGSGSVLETLHSDLEKLKG